MLSTILQVLSHVIAPSLLCQWFIADMLRKVIAAMKQLLELSLSSVYPLSLSQRVKIARDILVCVLHLRLLSSHDIPLAFFPVFLARYRLHEGPKEAWEDFDQAMVLILQEKPLDGVSKTDLLDVMKTLCSENWDLPGNGLRNLGYTFLRSALVKLDTKTIGTLQEELAFFKESPQYLAVLQLVRTTLAEQTPSQSEKVPMGSLRESLQVILGRDLSDRMDDEGEWDREHVAQILREFEERFERPLHDFPEGVRLNLAENMSRFPCLVTHCDGRDCKTHRDKSSILFAPAYITVVCRLLDGTDSEITPGVRREAFRALKRGIDHHAASISLDGLDQIGKFLIQSLRDADRSARLAAGYALAALVLCYSDTVANPWNLTQAIFAKLYHHMGDAKENTKEVVLVAVGSMGRTKHSDLLGQVSCFLVAQLGDRNPVIKGMASIQLVSLAKHHSKTPYTLLLPYLDQIAPFLIARISSIPSLLHETCKLMSIAPADFIMVNAPRTFPSLFAGCDAKAIDAVSREVGQKASTLFLNHSHVILAHLFMLPKPTETKAIGLVLKILADASQSEAIDLQVIVKLCLVKILGELVVAMGDENRSTVQMAVEAMKKVERILNTPVKGGNHPPIELSTFLKAHMLGLFSHVSDMLQDVQGKKSVVTKRKIIRGLGALFQHIGPTITYVAPQIMATFQTMASVPELSEVTLRSWHSFLTTLGPSEAGPHVGPTSATIVTCWNSFPPNSRQIAVESMSYIIQEIGRDIGRHLDDIVDLSSIPELDHTRDQLQALRSSWTPKERLQWLLERSSNENLSVAIQSLGELRAFLLAEYQNLIADLVSGDMFDPVVGQIVAALLNAACRDSDGTEALRALTYECIGIMGAVDPDRCELSTKQPRIVVKNNFTDEDESMQFALHLICDLLVGAFRSTSDMKYQSFLAYTIQELLKFCQFRPALVGAGTNTSISNKVRNRWRSLPKHILETATPLLEGKFTLNLGPTSEIRHPIYSHQATYREWIQLWTSHLITKASGPTAQTIFNVFRSAVRNKDAIVAHHLLPHLVLNILIGGNEEDAQAIRAELLVVLEDQINNESTSSADKKLLSAQAVFMLLDHLNAWVRIVRQDLNAKKAESKRPRGDRNLLNTQLEEQLMRIDSILSSIDHHLMAQAAFRCKAFARSLMNFERQIVSLKERSPKSKDLPEYYERLHEIYAQLDEPDGMEGVSTLILSPSLEHQIRQHESTGRWTSAQSCWEVRLQQSPDNVEFHLGLLRCLRNLGHYDTLRTHVRGVLTRKPEWQDALAGFQIESAWMVGAWDDVRNLAEQSTVQTAQLVIGRVLLAMRNGDPGSISMALANARMVLGAPITAAGPRNYRRSYDAMLDLHLTHELEVIYRAVNRLPESSQGRSQERKQIINELSRTLAARLDSTLPTFRFRELVLSMRRTAFSLASVPRSVVTAQIGRTWLASAKIARNAGQWQTAYSAMLQAQQSKARFSFIESAKLTKATDEPLRALKELENSMKLAGLSEASDVVDLTIDEEMVRAKTKAHVLRARWMYESQRYDASIIYKMFQQVTELDKKCVRFKCISLNTDCNVSSEGAHFYLGQFHDECFKNLSPEDQRGRGLKMNLATVRTYARAIKQGSKYVYQTVPRMLTIWLDLGESQSADKDSISKCNSQAQKAIHEVPAYKWYIAFPQVVSRVGHSNPETYRVLSGLILKVLGEYPKQALWLFTSVVKSTKANRENRGRVILEQLKNDPRVARTDTPRLVQQCVSMTNELLALCDHHVDDDKKTLHMRKDFPRLAQLGRCDLIIPLQESLTAALPPASSSQLTHQPFPSNLPMFHEFFDEIDIMRSLAKPRKISIRGTDGQTYMFLGKPKDDLRKDARLMEFNSIINKLLKANSESRKRQLRIRTYGVVTLNEECGFIQWVPNTIPVRLVLLKSYEGRRIRSWGAEMGETFKKIKEAVDHEAAKLFVKDILPKFPPVFHEWFLETFPEPSAWLASRTAYGRTAAVMSMVGFILGLGDRHCENILLDTISGDVGKGLETPERVPFRLTQNLVDGLGVTGVEGFFRIACEVTLQLLRDNKDSLMSVLAAFIHDPLVEWEDEKRRLDRQRNQATKTSVGVLAKTALSRIEKKLEGVYAPDASRDRNLNQEKEVSTSNLVQILIEEATDDANLAKMYPGWAAWH
ncbi:hypothetical protein P691DRAFT_724995 [Macrolepiota fuliginosa MF-IS2]|uniref:non-specific serine/threonine protein kinase n=1 Tax=Macrolepiota fuliginosa MF-IS2 TaxID=1400762 RepID=A0A9P5XJJ6_9AGAR|nr:hypothetical protein P691DRAFT_724995 [Macrolepiota fuliginosa MF-IS2]